MTNAQAKRYIKEYAKALKALYEGPCWSCGDSITWNGGFTFFNGYRQCPNCWHKKVPKALNKEYAKLEREFSRKYESHWRKLKHTHSDDG